MKSDDLEQAFRQLKAREPQVKLDPSELTVQIGKTRDHRHSVLRRRYQRVAAVVVLLGVGTLAFAPVRDWFGPNTGVAKTGVAKTGVTNSQVANTDEASNNVQAPTKTTPLSPGVATTEPPALPWSDSPMTVQNQLTPAVLNISLDRSPLLFTQTASELKDQIAILEAMAKKQRETLLKEQLSRKMLKN